MGHIHYFLSYRDQSYLFRDGANPAFHEAIADALSLAGQTQKTRSVLRKRRANKTCPPPPLQRPPAITSRWA